MNEKINDALEKKAENARELGLSYEPTTTDEDDEFKRIQHEIDMKAGQPYHFVETSWKPLSDKELLMAYGWTDFEARTITQEKYKDMILSGLRNVEKTVREKNDL